MMVVLLRHGPAGRRDPSRWPDDGRRPLTPRGIERTRAASRGLVRLLGKVSLVLTSPLIRAEQTAKILADVAGVKHVETLEALAPGHGSRNVIRRLGACASNDVVVLVGHEPDLGALAGTLAFGAGGSALPIKKSGALLVSFVGPVQTGRGQLRALLPPRLLRAFAGRRSRT